MPRIDVPPLDARMREQLVDVMDALATLGFVDPHAPVNGGDAVQAFSFVAPGVRGMYNEAARGICDPDLRALLSHVFVALMEQGFYNRDESINGADATDALGAVYRDLRAAPALAQLEPSVIYSASTGLFFSCRWNSEGEWDGLGAAEVLHDCGGIRAAAALLAARSGDPSAVLIDYAAAEAMAEAEPDYAKQVR